MHNVVLRCCLTKVHICSATHSSVEQEVVHNQADAAAVDANWFNDMPEVFRPTLTVASINNHMRYIMQGIIGGGFIPSQIMGTTHRLTCPSGPIIGALGPVAAGCRSYTSLILNLSEG